MEQSAIFAACARLRHDLADWIETLDAGQLNTRSLCDRWTVRDVAGHLTAVVTSTNLTLLRQVVRRGGNLHRANADLAIAEAARPVAELATRLRTHADTRFSPPVVGVRGPLTDLLVHDGDMRIPLGLVPRPDPDLSEVVLGFLTGSAPGFVPRRRLAGLSLTATDVPGRWGDGAEVRGTRSDLMMAVCGRSVVVPRLSGPGAATLAARISR